MMKTASFAFATIVILSLTVSGVAIATQSAQGQTGVSTVEISLSDDDNTRGYQLTVRGSGFNSGAIAGVYVLSRQPTSGMECADIIRNGVNVGSALVDRSGNVAVTFEVTVPTFMPGYGNYLCVVDGEGRASSTDVEQFELESAIRVVPSEVAAGDTVNVFAQDFPVVGASFNGILLAGQMVPAVWANSIGRDHSGFASFEVPGGIEGTVRVAATWGHYGAGGEAVNTNTKNSTITVSPSVLTLSKEEASANESIAIRGSGFGAVAGCLVSATMSGVPLKLISSDDVYYYGHNCIDVAVSSGGQFAATVAVWTDGYTNPALLPGTHTIEVEDDKGFTGTATITIREPTLTISPDVAGPGEYITISGANWPVENEYGGRIYKVEILIGSGESADDEDADPDASGRWSITYRVAGDVVIPSTVLVKASYGSGSEIVKVGSFSVPATARPIVEPARPVPSKAITLSASGLSPSESGIAVSANESVTLQGNGFGSGAGCLVSATISGSPLLLISSDGVPELINGQRCIDVEVNSNGQFAATVAVWTDGYTNPALFPGTQTIEVKDDQGFTAAARITIEEPTVMISPDVAGPGDYITISGANWPVENEYGGRIDEVVIYIGFHDYEDVDPDASGRWSLTYRVAGDVVIPSTVPVRASYGSGSEIVRVSSFSIPAANLMVQPERTVPGDTITLSATGFPLLASDVEVKIGGLKVKVPDGTHTDLEGAIADLEVIVPYLEPASYIVQISVGLIVSFAELDVDALGGVVKTVRGW